jgi:hypothetical protein
MEPLPWRLLVAISLATAAFTLILDQIKGAVTKVFRVE